MMLYFRDYSSFYIPRSTQWIDNEGVGRGRVYGSTWFCDAPHDSLWNNTCCVVKKDIV